MAPLPAGQPAVRQPRHDAGQDDAGRRGAGRPPRLSDRTKTLLAAFVLAYVAADLARRSGVVGRGAVPDLARAGIAGVALFGVAGFGLTRLLLPEGLRRYEPLWILPVGACALALSLTLLGFAFVPFVVSLPLVLTGFGALAVVAWRRTGGGPPLDALRRCGPIGYVALLVACIALIPLFRAGFATVGGEGQDAHMAVGTAQFLQEHHPLGRSVEEPVDEVWLVWRSKPPIYYALAAHAQVSGLEVYQVISTQLALLLAITVMGFFVIGRELLRAPPWVAAVGAALVGLDRMILHTIMHPYFNQSWGLVTLPFSVVLAWWAVKHRSRGGLVLLALLLAVGAFAYPLMLPIPGLALAIWLWPQRKRVRTGVRNLGLTRRSLWWIVPVVVVIYPLIRGVSEKLGTGADVILNPSKSLQTWGGDLTDFYEEAWFFGLPDGGVLIALAPALIYGLVLALRSLPREMARGLAAVLVLSGLLAISFRAREFGYYFHFKILAFVAPFALLLAFVGLAQVRRRWVGIAAGVLLVGFSMEAVADELGRTFDQLPKRTLELRQVADVVPAGDSVLIEVSPLEQNWIAFMLAERPVCSATPLLGTNYPRVRFSRKADFILAKRAAPRPATAAGAPVQLLEEYAVYRQAPGVQGPENCSRAMVQGVTIVNQG